MDNKDILSEIYDSYYKANNKITKKTSLKEGKNLSKKRTLKEIKPLKENCNKKIKEGIDDDLAFLDKMSKAVGNQFKEDKKSLTNTSKDSKIIQEDVSFLTKELGDGWRSILLVDDNSGKGGISFEGETLGDFMDEINGEIEIKSLEELNKALSSCGIEPIKSLTEGYNPKNIIWVKLDGEWKPWGGTDEDSVGENFLKEICNQNGCNYTDVKVVKNGEIPSNKSSLEEDLEAREDYVYESYLKGLKRYANDEQLARNYASCVNCYDISRLNDLINKKKGGVKND